MYDIQCECGAQYGCAESTTLSDASGKFVCTACGGVVDDTETSAKRVYRLILAPGRAYSKVDPPSAPRN
jgi:hypothetical protein